ncbi:MAG: PASTA domain-containing protein [Acidimicrobiales bacterium]
MLKTKVPRTTGLQSATALAVLKRANLVGEIQRTPVAGVAADVVLKSDPPEGTEVDQGSVVVLVVSQDPTVGPNGRTA